MLNRAFGFSKLASRYQGDLNEIALFPYNGLTTPQRMTMLEDHYRRLAYREPLNPLPSIAMSAGKGALMATAAVGMKQFGMNREAGMTLRRAMGAALHTAKWPAPLVGAAIAAPFGLIPVIKDRWETAKAKGILALPQQQRAELLHREVVKALR